MTHRSPRWLFPDSATPPLAWLLSLFVRLSPLFKELCLENSLADLVDIMTGNLAVWLLGDVRGLQKGWFYVQGCTWKYEGTLSLRGKCRQPAGSVRPWGAQSSQLSEWRPVVLWTSSAM